MLGYTNDFKQDWLGLRLRVESVQKEIYQQSMFEFGFGPLVPPV